MRCSAERELQCHCSVHVLDHAGFHTEHDRLPKVLMQAGIAGNGTTMQHEAGTIRVTGVLLGPDIRVKSTPNS